MVYFCFENWAELQVTIFYSLYYKDITPKSKQIFPEKELRGLSPNFLIHVSVSDL